ncbi:hypothetical protein ACIF8W_35050 [Streptomyces sp. NPDC085639]|uniref:hypothetical protein n=1 Tax=Streptomyces sp. NPDC085639 TaxID=3365734 RepID=UPI0037D09F16
MAALARRRDLPALLDRHVPLGPDQAAVRLGVRRTDVDQAVGSGGLRLTLAWPAGLCCTAASGPAGGVVRHGVAHAGPGGACVCARRDCGGVVPVSWCVEHGDAVGPVWEWHPGGGIRCTDLSRSRGLTAARGRED